MNRIRKAGIAAATATAATALITYWEGEDLVAKHNSFDPAGVVTVCNGITNYDWPWLKLGMRFTKEECGKSLQALIPKYAKPLQACVTDFDNMPVHRQAALISLSYNLGPGTVCGSSVVRELNAGNIVEGCERIALFVKANGRTLRGLVNRRTDRYWGERTWCLRPD